MSVYFPQNSWDEKRGRWAIMMDDVHIWNRLDYCTNLYNLSTILFHVVMQKKPVFIFV